MKQEQIDGEIPPCDNCSEAKSLENYVNGMDPERTYRYDVLKVKYEHKIDHLYRYCPGYPYCGLPDEKKVRKTI